MRGVAAVVAFVLGLLAAAQALAEDAPAARPRVSLAHGRDVSADRVGPAAGGFTVSRKVSVAVIDDSESQPFVRRIEETASYDGFEVPGPHLLVEDVAFTGAVEIASRLPLVMRGVRVRPAKDSLWAIRTRPQAGPVFLMWADAGGGAGARTGIAVMLQADHATIYRSHVSETGDGLRLAGADYSVVETLIDGLIARPRDHTDGIQTSPRASGILIERSRILNRNPQTSCLLHAGRELVVRDSYFAGGGWTVYGGGARVQVGGPSAARMAVTGNVFGTDYFPRSGRFGPVTGWAGTPGSTWEHNALGDGQSIEPGKKTGAPR